MYKRIHDSLPESRKLGKVSDFAFRLWANALPLADFYGRMTAEPGKLIIKCFKNRPPDQVPTEELIAFALDELADVTVGRSRGLIHLYKSEDGERCFVFHKHEGYNPTGDWKTKSVKYPAPPKSCRCTSYTKKEVLHSQKTRKPIGGKSFRFFEGFFPVDRSDTEDRGIVSDQCSSPASLFSSLSSEGGTPKNGVSKIEKPAKVASFFESLCDEFTSLTGRPAMSSVTDPQELVETLKGLLGRRGLDSCLKLMREKIRECQDRSGRPPSNIRYLVPIFQDDRLFAENGEDRLGGWSPADAGEEIDLSERLGGWTPKETIS